MDNGDRLGLPGTLRDPKRGAPPPSPFSQEEPVITMTLRRLAVAFALALAAVSPAMAQQPARPVTSVDDNTMLVSLFNSEMKEKELTRP